MSSFFIINIVLLSILSILPWIFFNYYNDILFRKQNPERFLDMLKAFLIGALSAFIIIYFKNFFIILNNNTFLLASLEEIFKAIALIIFLYIFTYQKRFNEISDGFVYGFLIGLGFAFIENIIYLNNNLNNFGISFDNKDIWIIYYGRMISSTLVHSVCSAIFGMYFAFGYIVLDKMQNLEIYIDNAFVSNKALIHKLLKTKQYLKDKNFELNQVNKLITDLENINNFSLRVKSILSTKLNIKTPKKSFPIFAIIDLYKSAQYHYGSENSNIFIKIYSFLKLLFSLFTFYILRNHILPKNIVKIRDFKPKEFWSGEYLIEGLWLSIFLHFLYNFILINGYLYIVIFYLFILFILYKKVNNIL